MINPNAERNEHEKRAPEKNSLSSLTFTPNFFTSQLPSVKPNRTESEAEEDGGYFYKDGKLQKTKGLSWLVTGLFVVGDLAGGGLVALPTAMIQFGFVMGMIFTVFISLIVFYTAYLLGECWCILQRRWPEAYTKGHVRKPYPEIAYRAMGSGMKHMVSGCVLITQFGVAIVFLLLSSKNIHDFLKSFFDTDIGFCVLVLIVALCFCPVTFLKSPQDFWGAVVMAMVTTSLAVVLILVGASLDYGRCAPEHKTPEFKVTNYFLAIGTFIFAYGGHAVFPTIQHDMRKPHEFTKASMLAFSILVFLYTPVSIMGYLTYGDSIRDSIINSLQTKWIQQTVNMLITIHCILTLTIVFNPINQEMEEYFHVPHEFGIKRVLVRSSTLLAVVFVAESLPTFGPLLDFVGGSTMTLTSLIFPCLFYLYLQAGEKKAEENIKSKPKDGLPLNETKQLNEPASLMDVLERSDKITLFCCTLVAVFSIIGGASATFSAVREMSYAHFIPPCYVSAFLNNVDPNSGGHTNCCGVFQNISMYGNASIYCSEPDFNFYT